MKLGPRHTSTTPGIKSPTTPQPAVVWGLFIHLGIPSFIVAKLILKCPCQLSSPSTRLASLSCLPRTSAVRIHHDAVLVACLISGAQQFEKRSYNYPQTIMTAAILFLLLWATTLKCNSTATRWLCTIWDLAYPCEVVCLVNLLCLLLIYIL